MTPPTDTRPIIDPRDPRRTLPGYVVARDGTVFYWNARQHKWIALCTKIGPGGFVKVAIKVDGAVRELGVARLVLRAFVGPRPLGCEPLHFPDTHPANNRLENLRWARIGTSKVGRLLSGQAPVAKRGEAHFHAVLCEADIPKIRALYRSGARYKEVAERFGVSEETVRLVLLGRTWSHVVDDAPQGMRRKGPASEDSPLARLDHAKARQIRERRAGGESVRDLAVAYEVSIPTIRDIVRGRTWKQAESSPI